MYENGRSTNSNSSGSRFGGGPWGPGYVKKVAAVDAWKVTEGKERD